MNSKWFRKPAALVFAFFLAVPFFLSADSLFAGAYEGALGQPVPNDGGGGSGGFNAQGSGSVSSGPLAAGSSSGSTSLPGGNASYNASGSVGGASAQGSYSASSNSSGFHANAQGGAQVNVAQGQFDANAQVNAGNVLGANAALNAQANLGANAEGAGNVDVGLSGINAAGHGNLFAGGQTSAGATISVNFFGLEIGLSLGGDGYTGLGVNVDGHFQMNGEGLNFGLGAGAAAGVGAGAHTSVFINYGGLVENAANFAGSVGEGIYNIGSAIWNFFGGGPEVQEALPLDSTLQFDGALGQWSNTSQSNLFGHGFSQDSAGSAPAPGGVPCPGE